MNSRQREERTKPNSQFRDSKGKFVSLSPSHGGVPSSKLAELDRTIERYFRVLEREIEIWSDAGAYGDGFTFRGDQIVRRTWIAGFSGFLE